MADIVARVEGLGKLYRMEPVVRSRSRLPWNLFRRRRPETASASASSFWALKDVSFEIERGEIVGIIGRNGAGKSTLLKILSRITAPTAGRVNLQGRVSSLLEVGSGFHPDLTGRENVYLNGSFLGMSRTEITRKLDEIVAFAEVEAFFDAPIKRYSSGMYMRLAFAVAAHLEPEILILDEVLAVGDAAFQQRCLGKINAVTRQGRTVLFVSHTMAVVQSLCTRCLLLERGAVRLDGPVAQAVEAYLGEASQNDRTAADFPADETLRIQLTRVELLSQAHSRQGKTLPIRIEYEVRREASNVFLAVEVRTASDTIAFYANDTHLDYRRKRQPGRHAMTLSLPVHLLAPGTYRVSFGFVEPGRFPDHFPDERLVFRREETPNGLSAYGIPWPSALFLPEVWSYGDGPAAREGLVA